MDHDFDQLEAFGRGLHQTHRWQEAVEHWLVVTERFPRRPMAFAHMGLALIKVNRLDEASANYRGLRERHPNNPWGYVGEGLISEAHHQWPDAGLIYANVLLRFPGNPQATLGLAKALKKQGRLSEAKACLQNGIAHRETPAMLKMLQKLSEIRKSDIVNQLIQCYGLQSYLEYNKPRCEMAFDEVGCPSKEVVYIPEVALAAYANEALQADCERAAKAFNSIATLEVDELLSYFGERRFDIIFFDPAHVRPLVDKTLKLLPRLLSQDGLLVVHDCNPTDPGLVGSNARPGAWFGDTYKAFANFHLHNPGRSITVDEDFGVGIILNRDLNLEYSDEFDVTYEVFSDNRARHNGLIGYDGFQARLLKHAPLRLFEG